MNEIPRIPAQIAADRPRFESEIVPAARPWVFEGLVSQWPLVRAARESPAALAALIGEMDAGHAPFVIEAPASARGRIFFRDDLAGFNFTRQQTRIGDLLGRLLRLADNPDPPALFLESVPVATYLPSFAATHAMPLLVRAEPRIWIGNAVKVNTHFDLAYNIACVVGGRRRFTLFPP